MFYEHFKQICSEKGTSVTAVTKICCKSTGIIGNWKKGISPKEEHLLLISEHLGVSIDRLLKGYDNAPELSENETDMLEVFRRLTPTEQREEIGAIKRTLSVRETSDKSDPAVV